MKHVIKIRRGSSPFRLRQTYFPVASLVMAILIGAGIYRFVGFIRQSAKASQEELLDRARFGGRSLERAYQVFNEDLKYMLSEGTFRDVYYADHPCRLELRARLKRFYARNHELIDEIRISDEAGNCKLIHRAKGNYYSISPLTNGPPPRMQRETRRKGERYLHTGVLPAGNDTNMLAVEITMNPTRFVESILSPFYAGRNSWIMLVKDQPVAIVSLYTRCAHTNSADICLGLPSAFLEDVAQGYEKVGEHDMRCGDTAVEVLSAYYPVRLFDQTHGVVFTIDRKELYSAIISTNIALASIFVIVVIFALTAFHIILRKRKHAEEENRKLSRAVEQCPDPILITDCFGEVEYVNPALVDATGYSREELYGRNPRILKSGHTTPGEYRELWETILRGKDWRGEFYNRKKSGEYYWESAKITPIFNHLGDITHFVGYKEDITDRKHAEEELRAAKDAAEAANLSKSEFLANMSHEIRTPMNGIIGMTDLLLETDLTQEQTEYLTMVENSADSLLSIINDILDFSKIEAGKFDLEPLQFDLADYLDSTIAVLSVRALSKGLELLYYIEPDVPRTVFGDPGRLRQVMVNLIGNAIKFTEKGEIVVTVSCDDLVSREGLHSETECALPHAAWEATHPLGCSTGICALHVSVADTGIGISREQRETIFQAFTQADASTTRKYGGTGLGLAICSRLVAMMGGWMWVDSKLGEGSSFHFTARVGIPEIAEEQHHPDVQPLRSASVLVIDDNAAGRRILEKMLKDWGMNPVSVENGVDAVKEIMRMHDMGNPFDIVIVDYRLSELDGFDLAGILTRSLDPDRTKTIVLTPAGRALDTAWLQQARIDAHLPKPVRQSLLLQTMTELLSPSREDGATQGVERPDGSADGVAPLRILLAEDDEVNQMVLLRLLRKRGHVVVVARSGKEAVDRWESEQFDLIFMDVQMPEINGIEATALIRDKEKATGTHTSIIALTAHAMRDDRQRCLDAGMDDYISKPAHIHELENVLATCVEQRRWSTGSSAPLYEKTLLDSSV